jgi:tetratricopeptide (TPR) repeat protein
MSKLLEIFGRAITVNTADLVWHWLNAMKSQQPEFPDQQVGEFDEVVELLGNMDLDGAEEKLKFHLFENPECSKGRMAAAAICLHRSDMAGAIEQLQSVYMRQPNNTMALYALGYCYEREGKEAEAIEFYQDCLKFKGHLQLPRQRMAAIYFKNGRLDKATGEYELLTSEHPEDISSLVALGYLYIEGQEYEKATETFNMAIVSHPDNFHDDSQDEEIAELIEAGMFDEAIGKIQVLVDQIGEMPDLLVKLADIYSHAGRGAEAIVHYEKALRLQPNYLEATIKLGTHYLRMQRITLAAEQFNRAVEINDEIVDAYIGLTISQTLGGQIEEAYGTLSLASAIQQNSTLLFSETATLNYHATLAEETHEKVIPGSSAAMIADVIRAHQSQIQQSPANGDIHYKYGILMMVANNMPEAMNSFENTLRVNPTHYRALSKLAICQFESGRKDIAAETLLKRSHELDNNTLVLHYQTAILYCDKQKFAKALVTLEKSMQENFTEPNTIVNVQVVLENLGLVDRAITTWDRLTETAHHAISARYQ